MRENLEMPKIKEFTVDEKVLYEAIDEILAEAGRDKKAELTEGFFWRVILLYCQKTGEKMPGSEEIGQFYAKIRPIITKALDEKGKPYESGEKIQEKEISKNNKFKPKSRPDKKYRDWVTETYG